MTTGDSASAVSDASSGGPRKLLVVSVIAAIAIIAIAVAVSAGGNPKVAGATTTGTTTVTSSAQAIIYSVVQASPSGFVNASNVRQNSGDSDWVILQNEGDGSYANVTVTVFPTANASASYYGRYVASVEGIAGYSDISSSLSSFRQFGACYGYGDDVDGYAVADGVCTKGNAFLGVHLSSSISFPYLEADLTSIMASLYQSAT